MKKVAIILFAFFSWQVAKAQEETVKTGPIMEFEEKLYNFGTITQGDTVLHTFVFKNVGTEPLRILSARGSCGCTVPKYSKDEIQPGEKGEVVVKFNSAGKMNNQNKTVTLMTNSIDKKPIILTIRGVVVARTEDGED
ncbi:DUF1573 domain-containing protein [Roseivirga sp.]|uniref:DUF1573 domain-containing protein n=1 Tax=Roseivirga sp. TaxID=1964215 RepID=UPI003B526CC0